MSPKFKLGDQVWRAAFEMHDTSIECPDCGGTGRLRVTFHDETTVSIECRSCARGYDPPTGRLTTYDRKPQAQSCTVTKIEIEADEIVYYLHDGIAGGTWLVKQDDISIDRDVALAKAAVMAEEASAEERRRLMTKEKDTRTWAWNASYHRKAIKEAERQIAYHTAKLTAANLKAKAERREEER